jgi:hypothetical protein
MALAISFRASPFPPLAFCINSGLLVTSFMKATWARLLAVPSSPSVTALLRHPGRGSPPQIAAISLLAFKVCITLSDFISTSGLPAILFCDRGASNLVQIGHFAAR